jgi:hypothetical protein
MAIPNSKKLELSFFGKLTEKVQQKCIDYSLLFPVAHFITFDLPLQIGRKKLRNDFGMQKSSPYSKK